MAKFVLQITCDSAAFEGDALVPEMRRVMRRVALAVGVIKERPLHHVHRLFDVNGNRIGTWEYDPGEATAAVSGGDEGPPPLTDRYTIDLSGAKPGRFPERALIATDVDVAAAKVPEAASVLKAAGVPILPDEIDGKGYPAKKRKKTGAVS